MRCIAVVFVVLLSCGIVMGQHYGPPAVTADGDTIWPVARIVGEIGGSGACGIGYSVDYGGDFNGDGVKDLILGSPNANKVYLFLGPLDFSGEISVSEADIIFTGYGIFGRTAHFVDVNGDSLDDIQVGADDAPFYNTGTIYIFLGTTSPDTLYSYSDADITIESVGAENLHGGDYNASIKQNTDFNGDGFEDIFITAGHSNRIYIFFGNDTLSGVYTTSDANITINTPHQGSWCRMLYDINGDGFSDLFTGQDGYYRPIGWVFYGNDTLSGSIDTSYANVTIYGNLTYITDDYTTHTASIGDINGDSHVDIMYMDYRNSEHGTSRGAIFIFFGSDTLASHFYTDSADVKIYGAADSTMLGSPSCTGPGDINADGYDDFVVIENTSSWRGRVLFYFGNSGISGEMTPSDAEIIIEGENDSDRLGYRVVRIDERLIPGYSKFAIGSPGSDYGVSNAGAVYIYEFSFPSTTTTCIPSLVFEDDFSDSTIDDKWYRVVYNAAGGSESDPPPYLDLSSDSAYAPSMVPNGDSWCANACYTRMEFDYTNGIIIEWDMNVTTSGSYWNSGEVGLSRGPVVTSRPRADSAYIDDTRCDVEAIASIEYAGVIDTHAAGFRTRLLRPDSSYEMFHLFDGYAHVGSWNHYKIYVRPDLHVEYYVNDTLLYVSTSTICTSYATVPLVAGGRNSPGPIWMDNFRVYICRSTSDTCLPEGLIAYYPFNGNANDESGHGHDGVVHGATLTEDMCGRADSAYWFDGTDTCYIEIENDGDFDIQHFTISAWVKWESGSPIHSFGGIFTNGYMIDHYSLVAGSLFVRNWINYPHSPDDEFIVNTSVLQDGNFHFLVATYNGSVRKLYIDGFLLDSMEFSEVIDYSTSENCFIGVNFPGGHDAFRGIIDNVRIYNRALSPDEVLALYECEYCKTGITEQKGTAKPTQLSISVIPNPFNASCKIIIDAPQPGEATIYDIVGTKVNSFKLIKGRNEFIWRAGNNPSGLYLIRAVAGKVQQSERVILIK